jgi:hypothetical protein
MEMAKKSIKEVANICINEGLGYAIQHYLDPEDIEDPQLRKLWEEADQALKSVDAFFEDRLGLGWEEE